MSENFRCSPNIISFTNTVCSYLFRESEGKNCGIGYISEDDLVASRMPPYSEEKVKVVLLENTEESEVDDIEASYIISEINRLLKTGKKADGSRILPGDIAILTRSNKEAAKMADELAKAGIPRANSTGNDLFENPEVLLMLCLLTATDNPQRDIPLAGALRSPIFGFSMSVLVNIRIGIMNMSLFDALTDYSMSDEAELKLRAKCIETINKLGEYRKIAEARPVHLFIRSLWKDINALSYAGSDKNSIKRTPVERRRNLRKFYEYARKFESSSFKGLHEFIDFINGIIDNGTKITDEDSFSESTVRIMTVHKSKGLEFPIVFLTGTNKYSGDQEARKPISFTSTDDLGIACKVSNEKKNAQIDTPFRLTINNRISEISSDEEIRILYVALTRARDNLYVIASGKEGFIEKKLLYAKRVSDIGGRYGILSSPRWIDRILIALSSDNLNKSYEICIPSIGVQSSDTPPQTTDTEINSERVNYIYELLKPSLTFSYPYDDYSDIPAKVSVSKLYPEMLNDAIGTESIIAKVKNLNNRKPRFLEGKTGAAERGTATHLFMQFCDFSNLCPTRESVIKEIERLVSEKYISNDIAKLIRVNEILLFTQSSLFQSISDAKQIYRELRFNIFLPASEFTTNESLRESYSEEKILVQGVIDLCYFSKDNELILCDYKTDRIPKDIKDNPDEVKCYFESAHKQQLKYYSYAINSIFGREPDKTYIYSLAYGDKFEIIT
jgi:ATP-dependent helicase/nuclease subunit A